MGLTTKDIRELKRRCPELEIEDRPKVKRKRRASGSFPESHAGIPVGRTVVIRDNKIIRTRKKAKEAL